MTMTLEERAQKAAERKMAKPKEEKEEEKEEGTQGTGLRVAEPTDKDILMSIATSITGIATRLEKLEGTVHDLQTNNRDAFKKDVRAEDVAAVSENRKGIDPKIVAVVDEVLGTDFGIRVDPLGGDQLGVMFTLEVPERMNDNPPIMRPVKFDDGYRKDAFGNVIMEQYREPDLRSRTMAAPDVNAIREHCERVRSNIVAYYATNKKPQPTLNVK